MKIEPGQDLVIRLAEVTREKDGLTEAQLQSLLASIAIAAGVFDFEVVDHHALDNDPHPQPRQS